MEKPASTPKHSLTEIDRIKQTAVCAICGPVRIYLKKRRRYQTQCCVNSGKSEATTLRFKRIRENTELIKNNVRSRTCKRCGFWSMNPNDFRFFEMHLPQKRRITALKNYMDKERLKIELERRDIFCNKCYPLIRKEVTHNISAPPLKPSSVL